MNEIGVSALVTMLSATHVVGSHVGEAVGGDDINLGEAHLLALVPASGEIPMKELAAASGNRPSSMGSKIDRLETKGLATRRRSTEDRRAVSVVLTEAGRELAAVVREAFDAEAKRLGALGVDLDELGKAAKGIVGGGFR